MADDSENPKQGSDTGEGGVYTLRVEHIIPDDVNLTYSDNYLVQHSANEFTLTFSQIQQPFALTDEDYANLTKVVAKVVARIIIPLPKMTELIRTLIANYNLSQEQAQKKLEALNVQLPADFNPESFTAPDDAEQP